MLSIFIGGYNLEVVAILVPRGGVGRKSIGETVTLIINVVDKSSPWREKARKITTEEDTAVSTHVTGIPKEIRSYFFDIIF